MPLFHCRIKPVSRSSGRSSCAAVAYRKGIEIEDERTGVVHDYTRRSGVEHTEIVAPEGAEWAQDAGRLWNAAEESEKRKDARVAREYEIALPMELSKNERKVLATDFAREISDRYGVAVDVSIHRPSRHGDRRNFHAHLMVTTRKAGPDGLGEKSEIELSDKKLRALGLPTGDEQIAAIRERWAKLANKALERAGVDARVDHRSLADQGIDRIPTEHVGVHATAMERRGISTDRGDRVREIRAANAAQVIDLAEARKQIEAEKIEQARQEAAAQKIEDAKREAQRQGSARDHRAAGSEKMKARLAEEKVRNIEALDVEYARQAVEIEREARAEEIRLEAFWSEADAIRAEWSALVHDAEASEDEAQEFRIEVQTALESPTIAVPVRTRAEYPPKPQKPPQTPEEAREDRIQAVQAEHPGMNREEAEGRLAIREQFEREDREAAGDELTPEEKILFREHTDPEKREARILDIQAERPGITHEEAEARLAVREQFERENPALLREELGRRYGRNDRHPVTGVRERDRIEGLLCATMDARTPEAQDAADKALDGDPVWRALPDRTRRAATDMTVAHREHALARAAQDERAAAEAARKAETARLAARTPAQVKRDLERDRKALVEPYFPAILSGAQKTAEETRGRINTVTSTRADQREPVRPSPPKESDFRGWGGKRRYRAAYEQFDRDWKSYEAAYAPWRERDDEYAGKIIALNRNLREADAILKSDPNNEYSPLYREAASRAREADPARWAQLEQDIREAKRAEREQNRDGKSKGMSR